MVIQAWQQMPMSPASGQPPPTQSQLMSSGTPSNQGQGLQRPSFPVRPNISSSGPPVPPFRAAGQPNSGSGRPQSMNPDASAGLFHGNATGQSGPGYAPSPATHVATRWQPPPPLPSGQRPSSAVSPPLGVIKFPVPPANLRKPPGISPPLPPPGTPGTPGLSGQIGASGLSSSSGNSGGTGSLASPGFSALAGSPTQSGKFTPPISPRPLAPGLAAPPTNCPPTKVATHIPAGPIGPGFAAPGANSGPSATPVPPAPGLATPPSHSGQSASRAPAGPVALGLAASPSHPGPSVPPASAGPTGSVLAASPSHSGSLAMPGPAGPVASGLAAPPSHSRSSATPVSAGSIASGLAAAAPQHSGSSAMPVSTGSVSQFVPSGPPGVHCSTGPPGISSHPIFSGTSGSSSSTSPGAQAPSHETNEGSKIGQVQSAPMSVASSLSAPLMPQAPHQAYVAGPALLPQQVSPWIPQSQAVGQPQLRPFSTYAVSFPTSFGQLCPSGSPQMGLPPINQSPSSSVLAPPGEQPPSQVFSGQQSNNWAGKIILPSVSSSQMVRGCIPSIGDSSSSVLSKSIASSGETEIAADVSLTMEESAKQEAIETWTAHKTIDGTVYYYNSVSGQSTYDRPLGYRGEPDKITSQPIPVAWEKLSGSDWALVTTNDGKKYYYNTKTQATSWHIPAEIVEMRRKQIEETTAKPSVCSLTQQNTISLTPQIPVGVTGGRESFGQKGLVPSTIGSSALDLVKKKLQDSLIPGTATVISSTSTPTISTVGPDNDANKVATAAGIPDKVKGNALEGSSSESSSDSEDEDPGPSKEERISEFKEMLKEKGVAPFSKWEKELPKIIFDPRFKAIPSHTERRYIFEHYVRTRAEEERKEKRAAQKAAIEGFKQLLEEASKDITHNTVYENFARIWGCDPRFDALDKKEREMLLNERVAPLRKIEEERIKALYATALSGFKAMLNESGEINVFSRWSRVKDSLRNDPRYKMVKRDDREALFNSYVAELRSAEQEAERVAKAKREEEEKLKEKEREMRKRKEREEQEMERVRAKARRKDAVTAYQALLTEKIRDPQASWTESRPKLEKDPLARATNPELDLSDYERLFRDHVKGLYERSVREYRALLADIITAEVAARHMEDGKNILTSWSEAKKLLKSDPRYSKVPRNEREPRWRKYAEVLQQRCKVLSSNTKEENHPDKALAVDSNRSPAKHGSSRR